MAHNYEKLESWKRGCQLTVSVHDAFRGSSEYVFRDQMLRSSLSIPSNIAEGSERQSEKEFLRYINFAISSAAELHTQALICHKSRNTSDKQLQIHCRRSQRNRRHAPSHEPNH